MMGIGAVGSYEYGYGYGYGVDISPFGSAAAGGTVRADDEKSGGIIVNPGESTKVSPGRRSSPAECETCKNRKYHQRLPLPASAPTSRSMSAMPIKKLHRETARFSLLLYPSGQPSVLNAAEATRQAARPQLK